MTNELRKNVEGAIFLVLFCLTIPAANWMIGNVGTVCVAERALPDAGRARPDGAVRRADDRRALGTARSGAAPPRRRIRHRRHHCRRRAVGGGLAPHSLVHRVGRGLPAVGTRRFRGLYAAGRAGGWCWRWSLSSLVGLVVDSIDLPVAGLRLAGFPARARLSARPGWCFCRSRWSPIFAAAT